MSNTAALDRIRADLDALGLRLADVRRSIRRSHREGDPAVRQVCAAQVAIAQAGVLIGVAIKFAPDPTIVIAPLRADTVRA